MFVFVLSSLLLLLIGSVCTLPEVCNPIECFHIVDTLFQPSNSESETSCERITKLERCIRFCTANKTDNFFLKGLAELKEETCMYHDAASELENKCGNKHKFRLISCVYENFHLEAEDPNENKNLVMCRQAADGEYCDVDTLPLCTDRESFLSKTLLMKLFQSMRNKFCFGYSIADTYDLKLKPLTFIKDYNSLAECLDTNRPYVTDCIPKKWIATNIQQESKLFSDVQSFFNCVERVVQNKCNDTQKSTFSRIKQPVFSYLLPECADKQLNGASPLKSLVTSDNFRNEVYSDSASESVPIPSQNTSEIVAVHGLNKIHSDSSMTTTIPTQNNSEVVVVHQHVIITMTYKDKNAANQIYVCYYLIVMAVLFVIGKEF